MASSKLRADANRVSEPDDSRLLYIVSRKAHQIPVDDPLFIGLREDYPDFDSWFAKCQGTQRDCWIVEIDGQLAGLVIRKEETHAEALTTHPGPRILKICTLKMKTEYFGEKFGEQLLKKILWFARANGYDLIYVTAFPKHQILVGLLETFGFRVTQERARGELVMERPMVPEAIGAATTPGDILAYDLRAYPHFYDGPAVRKYLIPIRSEFHVVLFPEIADAPELPMFPGENCRVTTYETPERAPGNTIRKVYVCRSPTRTLTSGDVVLFYLSKSDDLRRSQSLTTLGVVEQVHLATGVPELLRRVGRRSVYSHDTLEAMKPTPDLPVLVIDFLLNGHFDPPASLSTLLDVGAFVGAPSLSIKRLQEDVYLRLKGSTRVTLE